MRYSDDELTKALQLLQKMQMDNNICNIKTDPKSRLFFEYVITKIIIQRNAQEEIYKGGEK